ncbi:Hsp20/alpha crystallin family protein [Paraburkholderia polaris]|uniref:Hsp20/alpha crystallin family protein n=1 Tax=Paraburkholderia polaris TaxID=2728848 RepID=UPI001E28D9DB|nr:hypothetical protein [Paraburkholderia polaris]
MSDLYFGTELFSELDRLQRQMSTVFGGFPSSLRSSRLGTFPPINIGTTDDTIEIVAFAPGIDASKLDISIDKGLLTIAGEGSVAVRKAGQAKVICEGWLTKPTSKIAGRQTAKFCPNISPVPS